MYRGRTWTLRQLAGFGPPEETNRRYRLLLKEGATGINGVFDYPTLRGYDSTDPIARADAGRGGVAIDTLEDMRILFDGIPIEKISSSLVTCQPICNITVQSMYFANAQDRDVPLNRLTGTSQNDFLMETTITVAPEVVRHLRERGMEQTVVVLGGTIPPDDIPKLKEAGIAEVFGPGTALKSIINFLSGSL
jgi:methylmalonyl-CoA mutase N-terminal domain/subunit